MLSPRSPSGASAPITKPRKPPCSGVINPPRGCGPREEKAYEKKAPIARDLNSPATYPSQLFFGLRRGDILCLPYTEPMDEAPVAPSQRIGRTSKTHQPPSYSSHKPISKVLIQPRYTDHAPDTT